MPESPHPGYAWTSKLPSLKHSVTPEMCSNYKETSGKNYWSHHDMHALLRHLLQSGRNQWWCEGVEEHNCGLETPTLSFRSHQYSYKSINQAGVKVCNVMNFRRAWKSFLELLYLRVNVFYCASWNSCARLSLQIWQMFSMDLVTVSYFNKLPYILLLDSILLDAT